MFFQILVITLLSSVSHVLLLFPIYHFILILCWCVWRPVFWNDALKPEANLFSRFYPFLINLRFSPHVQTWHQSHKKRKAPCLRWDVTYKSCTAVSETIGREDASLWKVRNVKSSTPWRPTQPPRHNMPTSPVLGIIQPWHISHLNHIGTLWIYSIKYSAYYIHDNSWSSERLRSVVLFITGSSNSMVMPVRIGSNHTLISLTGTIMWVVTLFSVPWGGRLHSSLCEFHFGIFWWLTVPISIEPAISDAWRPEHGFPPHLRLHWLVLCLV